MGTERTKQSTQAAAAGEKHPTEGAARDSRGTSGALRYPFMFSLPVAPGFLSPAVGYSLPPLRGWGSGLFPRHESYSGTRNPFASPHAPRTQSGHKPADFLCRKYRIRLGEINVNCPPPLAAIPSQRGIVATFSVRRITEVKPRV